MNIAQIENNLQKLILSLSEKTFIYELLLAYGQPKASITRLRKGNLNLSKMEGVVSWKKKVFFKEVPDKDLHIAISDLVNEIKHDQRFVIVTDYETLLAIDTKTQDKLDIDLKDLPKHYDFFLPWAGMEKAQHQNENPADVKAAVKMAKLFDEIKKDNPDDSPYFIHNLNVFLSRLLFCLFAEDTNIFEDNQFISSISSHTQADGSDLNTYLDKLFQVLDTSLDDRKGLPAYLKAFPYVNGGLFNQRIESPKFTRRSRKAIIDSGELDWSAINPDIFGSMFQAVITPEHRGGLGMHYTSVPNIMKVIEPLFLNDLYEEFEKANGNKKKLNKLLERINRLKIFDPACGSGNFLIIAYKELRKLEMKIFKKGSMMAFSSISLSQFYAIELDDFAHEIAMLSLWLAEHQMNVEFFNKFGKTNPTLPLKDAGNIVQGNATRLNWEGVCPKSEGDEIFILGNPPYLGFQERNKEQKSDMDFVFKELGKVKRLDYIGCWFKLATDFINGFGNCKYAFVSTNSICQGEQVSLIWPYIFNVKQEIFFAYQSFHWGNNAKNKAGVTCIIAGIQNTRNTSSTIYTGNKIKNVRNISPYLIEGNNIVIYQRNSSIANFPTAILGSSGIDGGHLVLTPDEKDLFIKEDGRSEKFIKRFVGGGDFLNGIERYCLWIDDSKIDKANSIINIKNRIEACRAYRLNAGRDAKKASDVPHRFFYRKHKDSEAIVFPMTSSGRREYLPAGYSTDNAVISNGAFVIYNSNPFLFGIISSRIHCIWMSITSARMRNDYRYSVNLTYNNFPFPPISDQRKEEITQGVFCILEEREMYSEKTLAQLYDPNKMPKGLREAHRLNDLTVERCYRSKPFESDEERLEFLFKLYEKMIAEEQEKNTLFEKPKKTKKRKK